MIMTSYKHMSLDDRIEIQKGLKDGKTFAEIGAAIGRDGSTISKEVRGHLIIKETGARSRPYYHTEQRCFKPFARLVSRLANLTARFVRLISA